MSIGATGQPESKGCLSDVPPWHLGPELSTQHNDGAHIRGAHPWHTSVALHHALLWYDLSNAESLGHLGCSLVSHVPTPTGKSSEVAHLCF